MSKHFKPSEVVLAEFWVLIDDDERDVYSSLKAAEDDLRRCYEGATLWHCRPGDAVMRDITEDCAQDWFAANAEPHAACPDAYRPYVGEEVDQLTEQYEDRGHRNVNRQHSTHYRGIGL